MKKIEVVRISTTTMAGTSVTQEETVATYAAGHWARIAVKEPVGVT